MGFRKAKKIILYVVSFVLIMVLIPFNITTGQAEQKIMTDESVSPAPTSTPEPISTTVQMVAYANLKFPSDGIPVLMYHSISTDPGNTLCVPEKQFAEEMEWLRSQNYHTITVDQFYQAFANGVSIPEKPVLITFDDGYKDNYQTAWPILKQNGFVGTFFIITKAIVPSRIDVNQLKDLVKNGNSIGSHTVNHLNLTSQTDSNQEIELRDSKKTLEDLLGIKITSFCYPSGKFNQTTQDLLAKLDYKMAFTTASGRVHLGDNQYKLNRLRISGGMTIATFKYLLT